MRERDSEAVRLCAGRSLSAAARSCFVFDGKPDEGDFGELELQFDDGRIVTLHLAPDGESVRASLRPLQLPEPFGVGESGRCEWERVDLAHEPRWANLVGRRVVAVDAVVHGSTGDPYDLPPSGWRLRFEPAGSLLYANNGDESIVMWSGLPAPFEGMTMRAVQIAP